MRESPADASFCHGWVLSTSRGKDQLVWSSSSSVTLFPWSQPSGPRSRSTVVAVTVPWEGLRRGRVCTVPLSVYIKTCAVRYLSYVGASSLRVCSFGPVWCRCLSVVTWWFPLLFCAVRRSPQKCLRVSCVLGAWGLRSVGGCWLRLVLGLE